VDDVPREPDERARPCAKLEAMLLAPDFDTLDRYLAAPEAVQ
jgi:hypothetical protein